MLRFTAYTTRLLLYTALLFSIHVTGTTKPVSLVLEQQFGSDPYNQVAYNNGIFAVTGLNGAGAGAPFNNSRVVDILNFDGSEFTPSFQYEFFHINNASVENVLDVSFFNGYWLFLIDTNQGLYLVNATIQQETLTIISENSLDSLPGNPTIVAGNNNNVYVADVAHTGSMSIHHFNVSEAGQIGDVSVKSVGITPNNFFTDNRFSISFDNNVFFIVLNQETTPATLFTLPVDEQGIPLDATEIAFDEATERYVGSLVKENLWFLGSSGDGLQVLEISNNNDQVSLIYQSDNNFSYTNFERSDSLLFAISTFGSIHVYQINNDNQMSFHSSFDTDGFLRDSLLIDDLLVVSKDFEGIEAISVENSTDLSSASAFSQSGEVTDFDIQDSVLVTSSLNHSVHFWTLGSDQSNSLDGRYTYRDIVAGVEFFDDDLLLFKAGSLERHTKADILAGVDNGIHLGSAGITGSNGEVITLSNGVLARTFDHFAFFTSSLTQVDRFELNNVTFSSIFYQPVFAEGNNLFVPTNIPNEVTIYDSSDLTQVTPVAVIERQSIVIGGVYKNGDLLFVPDFLNSVQPVVNLYNVSDASNPVLVNTIEIPHLSFFTHFNDFTVYINGNYLVVINGKGFVYDISNPNDPILIDENDRITSNGISFGENNRLFTVARGSGGFINQIQINLAPTHADVNLRTDEDTTVESTLLATDTENDEVSFAVFREPENGQLSIVDNLLTYMPNENFSGSDNGEIQVSDIHGGTSVFQVNIEIAAVNDVPIILSESIETAEDQSVSMTLEIDDVDDTIFTYMISSTSSLGITTISESGVLTYTPSENIFGTDSITVSVTDNSDAETTREIPISITAVNDAPEFTGDTEISVDEDNSFTLNLTAQDVEDDAVSYNVTNPPEGWSTVISNDVLEVTPQANDNGSFQLQIDINDGTDSTLQTITINVNPINDAPFISNDTISLSVTQDRSVSSSVNFEDIDDGDELTLNVATQPTSGQVTLSQNGQFQYTPNSGATGTDSFVIEASDQDGEVTQASVTVIINERSTVNTSDSRSGGALQFWQMWLLCLLLIRKYTYRV
ncbi:Ig-like domain-containing protein [Agaribacter marinus]|uniref:Cadherin domain-containing protein n=1 Tax=Agaribacter marinus TaxID=1431249 RepID=A0AA37SYL4_9ALTE|nr:Ig-like domain-containing protein [Agaribacter marinus]GLR71602.1 hypothetical protein GCM10007852_25100 [Agaribacter marinus]